MNTCLTSRSRRANEVEIRKKNIKYKIKTKQTKREYKYENKGLTLRKLMKSP